MNSNVVTNIEGSTLPDSTLTLLSRPQRRTLLRILVSYDQPQAVADLATELALREHTTTVDAIPWEEVNRIYVRFHHVHLPKLDDAGFLVYDKECRMVALTARGERLITEFEPTGNGLTEVPPDG